MSVPTIRRRGGPIAWMASNPVAANLLMALLILGGAYMMTNNIQQEYLPSTEPDTVTVTVESPGATPDAVEQSIVLVLENAISGVDGIDKVIGKAYEGTGALSIELATDRPINQTFQDIQQAIDGITTLPDDAEDPVTQLKARSWGVLDIVLHGPVDEMSIRMAAEHVRSGLLQHPGITQVDIEEEKDIEIHVEINEATLRAYRLTVEDVSRAITETALDRSGGTLETRGGDLLLRMADRRDDIADFASIPVLSDPRGTVVRLGEIASISRGFKDDNNILTFDGNPARQIEVQRVGGQTPISVADAVREVLPALMNTLPAAVEAKVLNDRSENFRGRMDLLTQNGLIGLALVLLLLSLFLDIRLAFWVALGIPTAFMGAMLVLPQTDMTINMVTMFAFILALGIVVDDAIVAGENIYEYRQQGMAHLDAAIQGARDIAVPLSFSILTNIVAFIPLALVPGFLGKLFFVIPVVVSLAFIMSWVEALFILPAHLAHGDKKHFRIEPPVSWIFKLLGTLERWFLKPVQWVFAGGLAWFTRRIYGPLLSLAIGARYLTASLMIVALMIAVAWVSSGRMGFGLFPPVPRDYAKATINMPVGAPIEAAMAARDQAIEAARRVVAANGGDTLGDGVRARISGTKIDVRAYLTPPEQRPLQTSEFVSAWRRELGAISSARSIQFESSWGGPGGTSVNIRLSHPDTDVLAEAAAALAAEVAAFAPVRGVKDGFSPGKRQLEFRLTEAGRSLGLSSSEVGAQVRAAFFGVTALSQQDGRNEIGVRVRRPVEERSSEADIETMLIRTPDGGMVPLFEVARIERSRADSSISREENQRVVSVTANVEPRKETNKVVAAVQADVLPQLVEDYPGLSYSLEGRQATQRETMSTFVQFSIPLALVIIYGLLAIPFRSYLQPMVIMMAIPFGFVGAIIGHLIMGYSLSIISIFGIIALSGVVINAGIVMIDYANKARDRGETAESAIWQAGVRRFRPILLTTITTFVGLAPMIFETSRQAKFLIPMAISLGYGILFATVVVLFLIPALYIVLEDIKNLVNPMRMRPAPKDNLPIPGE